MPARGSGTDGNNCTVTPTLLPQPRVDLSEELRGKLPEGHHRHRREGLPRLRAQGPREQRDHTARERGQHGVTMDGLGGRLAARHRDYTRWREDLHRHPGGVVGERRRVGGRTMPEW